MTKKKVIITGGAGFIGSHLVDSLVGSGYDVTVYDNLSTGRLEFLKDSIDRIELVREDLLNDGSLPDRLEGTDHVFHLAANPDVRIGVDDTRTSVDQNIIATYNLLEAIRRARDGPRGFTFTSTSTVYGNATVLPTPEDYGPLVPISQYGASKLAAEALISAFSDNFGIRATCLRFANVVGSRSTHGILIDFINKLKKDPTSLEILGDGTQMKSYIHVSDCVRGMRFATERQVGMFEYFNLGTDDSTTVTRIAHIVIEAMGLQDVELVYTGGYRGAGWKGDVKYMSLKIDKIKELGWNYRMNSEKSLRSACEELLR